MDAIRELYQQAMYNISVRRRRIDEQTAPLRVKCAEHKEQLRLFLDEDGKGALDFYEDSLEEMESVKRYEVFRMGVQMGASLMRQLSGEGEEDGLFPGPCDPIPIRHKGTP